MANTTCGWCGCKAHMQPATTLQVLPGEVQGGFTQGAFTCANCKRLNLATESTRTRVDKPITLPPDSLNSYKWGPDTHWLPSPGERVEYADVPPHIASAASEAHVCLTHNAYRAVGALARAVVEATAKDKEADGKTLFARIDALAAGGHIRPHTKDLAHEIRHFGNDIAHGDFTEPVSRDDAEQFVGLMAELLDEVYQSPATVARLTRKRQGTPTTSEDATPEAVTSIVV